MNTTSRTTAGAVGQRRNAARSKGQELVDDAEKALGRDMALAVRHGQRCGFTPYRRRFFKKCEKLGIKGIKLDHIESETQFMTEFYRRFAREWRQSTN